MWCWFLVNSPLGERRRAEEKVQRSSLRFSGTSGRFAGQYSRADTRGHPCVGIRAAAACGLVGAARCGRQGAAECGAAGAGRGTGRRQLRSGSERRSLLGG